MFFDYDALEALHERGFVVSTTSQNDADVMGMRMDGSNLICRQAPKSTFGKQIKAQAEHEVFCIHEEATKADVASADSRVICNEALGNQTDNERHADEHWLQGAAAFATMLIEMREQSAGGQAVLSGLRSLLEDPAEPGPYPAGQPSFMELATRLLQATHASRAGTTPWAEDLRELLARVEAEVQDETLHVHEAFEWACHSRSLGQVGADAAADAGSPMDPPFGGFGPGNRHIFFVGLPLILYVTNTTHLYEMLRRLREVRFVQHLTPGDIQDVLDGRTDGGDNRPYSALIFAVIAALQSLRAAVAGDMSQLDPLAATGPEGPPHDVQRGKLMFRALWVPQVIDDDAASRQWSFNSFSRQIEGTCCVLNFYAKAEQSPAAKLAKTFSHVLMLVAKKDGIAASQAGGVHTWAFNVQFFNGIGGRLEQELVVPPFAEYTFEESLELRSTMPQSEQERRITELEGRWQLGQGGFFREAALLVKLLRGERSPWLSAQSLKLPREPVITVRFIRSVRLAEPVQRLFLDPGRKLWSFPPE